MYEECHGYAVVEVIRDLNDILRLDLRGSGEVVRNHQPSATSGFAKSSGMVGRYGLRNYDPRFIWVAVVGLGLVDRFREHLLRRRAVRNFVDRWDARAFHMVHGGGNRVRSHVSLIDRSGAGR
jgi:hypothetical protein